MSEEWSEGERKGTVRDVFFNPSAAPPYTHMDRHTFRIK